jgi:hypothetical protein
MSNGTIAIAQEEYDRMVAAEELLERIIADHGTLDYDTVYPELWQAAGY